MNWNKVIDAVLLVLLFGIVLFSWSNGVDLALTLDQWDHVATAGWAMLPIAVTWLVCALAKLARAVRELIEVEHGTQAAKTLLVEAQAKLAEAEAGRAEADMWASRHEAKRRRTGA